MKTLITTLSVLCLLSAAPAFAQAGSSDMADGSTSNGGVDGSASSGANGSGSDSNGGNGSEGATSGGR